MSRIPSSPTIAFLHIPSIVSEADTYANSDNAGKNAIIEKYNESIFYQSGILFYATLITNIDVWYDYDYFNWIPLEYDEITMLITYGNTLPTLLQNRIESRVNDFKVKVIYG